MSTPGSCCLTAPSSRPPRRTAIIGLRRIGRWTPRGGLGLGLLTLALPKCPACIAGYVSVLGLSAGVGAAVAGALRPALIAAAILATAAFVRRRLMRHE